jgi:hypothetical protein
MISYVGVQTTALNGTQTSPVTSTGEPIVGPGGSARFF